ncbi:GPI mannosyltransferase 1 [Coemansia sp. RSA 532]|nr:GPI mannosyltransferase 1 [Coemansia sp. RSA 637]KAJ2184568.1 GPI mannosyltransferase 1 [Coemansia sp. RSA 532]KAJ2266552.1 GPI mannosyltransferase 1 [Coemansia sp. RSA 371]KAJ2404868.1 GPI mannosyltransferase 1 [Coemansia sp. RSA 2526]KAJ2592877.1 GPI mannosyltransferase 1 [Coemansia sp. RSA 1797]
MQVLTVGNVFTGGVLLRILMLVYGLWQDAHMTVKYTDIDYHVFTDAARSVWMGGSPYERSTYRYTPLLAWLLTPNVWLHPVFGKCVFILCDCLVGWLIVRILAARKLSDYKCAVYSALWMLNPYVANISTRGSAESVVCACVMAVLYEVQQKRIARGSVLFGLAVHLKIYPIIYAVPLLVVLSDTNFGSSARNQTVSQQMLDRVISWFNVHRAMFFVISASVFFALNVAMYAVYGMEFVDETYVYHVSRKDHRHNYSMWFLPIYLQFYSPTSLLMGLVSFVPQALAVAVLGVSFNSDLYFAAFTQTFAFVAYNKVCTAQYFIWYMCILPVVWPYSKMGFVQASLVVGVWVLSQALYLQQAYKLEFLGQNTFEWLWVAGAGIFVANNWILSQVVAKQRVVSVFDAGKELKVKKAQ